MSKLIFKATCSKNTFIFKTLIEMMSQISSVENKDKKINTIKQLSMKISSDNIELYSDSKKVVTGFAILEHKFFSDYFFSYDCQLCIGISLDLLKSCFKNVNRNDVLIMKIYKEEYNVFPNLISFSFNETKGFDIKFNLIQNMDNNSYENYHEILTIESMRYANLYKEVGGVKKLVELSLSDETLKLTSSMIDIAKNWVIFKRSENKNNLKFTVPECSLKSEYLKITSKISTLDNNLKLSLDDQANILLSTHILNLRESKQILGNMFINILTQNDNNK